MQIMLGRSGAVIPMNPNAEQIDLAWACLRHLRTGEPLSFESRLDLLAFAEAERDYSRRREEGVDNG